MIDDANPDGAMDKSLEQSIKRVYLRRWSVAGDP